MRVVISGRKCSFIQQSCSYRIKYEIELLHNKWTWGERKHFGLFILKFWEVSVYMFATEFYFSSITTKSNVKYVLYKKFLSKYNLQSRGHVMNNFCQLH
jgi:hypothetical protein